MRFLLVALTVALVTLSVAAELAPEVYERMQRAAPEVVQLEVVDVDVDRSFRMCGWFDFETTRNVTMRARVTSIIRSRSGLHPGMTIDVKYISMNFCDGTSAPRPIRLLDEGERVTAYLAKKGNVYEPAARGASF